MKPHDYHNEIDGYAAQWTRNLMKKGLIPDGFVDERDIRDVQPMDLWGFTRCHFFSGIAGWACALRLAGVPDDFPLWTGSCPCQPFSVAGQQKGFADERHLWPIWAKLIAQSRPAIVLGEQVAGAAAWLRLVRGDLEAVGYAVGAIPVEAASAGAYHLRDRIWFVAYSESEQARAARQPWQCGDVEYDQSDGRREGRPEHDIRSGWPTSSITSGASALADASQSRRQQDTGSPPRDEAADGRAGRDEQQQNGDHVVASDGQGHMADTDSSGSEDGLRLWLLQRQGLPNAPRSFRSQPDANLDWVIGADGKSRRIKPGIRLLAYGIPNRASKLRAYGNAIDLRPAAAFIEAALACRP
jgi:DNA (cytosine-5)-methyltransferase 1